MPEKQVWTWVIGGQQGEGIDSVGEIFAGALHRAGWWVYASRHFMSRIKGGHTHYTISFGAEPVNHVEDEVDVVLALDREAVEAIAGRCRPDTVVLYDRGAVRETPSSPAQLFPVPLTERAKALGDALMRNIVGLGATARAFGLPENFFDREIQNRFRKKGMGVVAANRNAVREGFAAARGAGVPNLDLPAVHPVGDRMFLNGDEAMALGAVWAGCRLFFAYPITPASEILENLAEVLPKLGGACLQAEDEIAAVNYAIGAMFAGVRAFTATAGPGFSLMQEGISLAGMTETPLVVVDVQRAGPATGLPTKPEQSDVALATHAGHGDVPRMVLAPADHVDAYRLIQVAFNLAERYQCPVIVLSDLLLGLDKRSIPLLDPDAVSVDRGELVLEPGEGPSHHTFPRYRDTASGISPRPLPGVPGREFVAVGDEHTEEGHITEDPAVRAAQMRKRLRKLEHVAELEGEGVRYEGDRDPHTLLIGVGSTWGLLETVRRRLSAEGQRIGHAHLRVLRPFPTEELKPLVDVSERVVVVEHSATGQLAELIAAHTGRTDLYGVRKFDGEPFTVREIMAQLAGVTV